MNPNNKMLIGTWISDPKDTESIRRFGNVKLHFTADGRLIYIIPGEEKDQKMFLTYRVENNILITDQPSVPREERANFRITTDGKLEWECFNGSTVNYVREPLSKNHLKVPVETHRTAVSSVCNFAQFVGFYTAHVIWYLEGLEGENVSPLLAIQKEGEAWIERFESSSYESMVAKARELYNTVALSNGDYALLAYDGFLTRADKRDESLFIQAFERRHQEEIVYGLIVPYSSARNTGSLAIGQIEISPPRSLSDTGKKIFLDDFKQGAYSHTKGFEFWNNHWDRNLELILIRE